MLFAPVEESAKTELSPAINSRILLTLNRTNAIINIIIIITMLYNQNSAFPVFPQCTRSLAVVSRLIGFVIFEEEVCSARSKPAQKQRASSVVTVVSIWQN